MTRKTLPKKLSDCLELALKDLAQVERMKRTYTVSMYRWHEPNGKCTVCLAGSVMARTLERDPSDDCGPTSFDDARTRDRLYALNFLRQGDIAYALGEIGRATERLPDTIAVTDYMPGRSVSARTKRSAFKRDMCKIVKLLRSAGE